MAGKLWAYIDETGDRGFTPQSSPIFGMASVIVDAATSVKVRTAVKQLRQEFNVPDNKVLSWKRHVKTDARRNRAAQVLAAVPGVQVLYSITRKADLFAGSFGGEGHAFYDHLAGGTYRAILWASRNRGAKEVAIRFGHVIDVDPARTRSFIEHREDTNPKVPNHLVTELSWIAADRYFEHTAADLYAGFMKAAFWPSAGRQKTDQYLKEIWHQVRKGPDGCAIPLGFFPSPKYSVLANEPWFWCAATCKHVAKEAAFPTDLQSLFANLGPRTLGETWATNGQGAQ